MPAAPSVSLPARLARAMSAQIRRLLSLPLRRPLDTLGVSCALLYALPALFYPHGNDQALHWYVGKGILLGEVPYRDSISGKPLGIFLIHALADLLFGSQQWAIRALEALSLLPLAAWLAALLRDPDPSRRQRATHDGELGCAALLLFGIHYTFFDYWDVSHPESWVAWLNVAAALVVQRSGHPHRRAFYAGLLGGAAFMCKYTGAAIALPVAMYCGLRAVRDAGPLRATPQGYLVRTRLVALLSAALLYLLGVACVFALCIVPFLWLDAFGPMWEVLYTFTTRYVERAPGAGQHELWIGWSYGGPALVVGSLAPVLGLLLQLARKRWQASLRGLLLLSLLAGAVVSVWIQQRFFNYHFTVLSPFLAGGILYLLQAVGVTRFAPPLRLATALGLLGLALYCEPQAGTDPSYSYLKHVHSVQRYLAGELDRHSYLQPFRGQNRLDRYWIHETVGLAIRARKQPGDTLCVRGFAPAIYQVSGLRCPSRHVIETSSARLPNWGSEFTDTIEQQRPRFLVSFSDRRWALQRYMRLGYRPQRMPSLFVLLEHSPRPPQTPASSPHSSRPPHSPRALTRRRP